MSAPLYNHVVEIGAGDRASSEALDEGIWKQAGRITLYEPNKILYADLVKAEDLILRRDHTAYKGYVDPFPFRRAVQVINAAVASATWGQLDFYHMGYASWASGAPSFVATSVEPEGLAYLAPLVRKVSALEAAKVVGPDVDLLILTCNGCERVCLESMDRNPHWPAEIRTKHYMHNAAQVAEAQAVWLLLGGRGYRGTAVERNQHGTFCHIHWRQS